MNRLRYTLVTDGSSDALLMPILTWLLIYLGVARLIDSQWAELRTIRRNRPRTLSDKIRCAMDLYPCDLLFIHRDAERESREKRACEINHAVNEIINSLQVPPRVCVIPVRM